MRIKSLLKAESMIGKSFNRLTVISLSDKRSSNGHIYINCLCSCGKEFSAWAANVESGNTKSCGCLAKEHRKNLLQKQQQDAHNRAENLIGKSFGALLITGLSDKKTRYGHSYVKASCKCGNQDADIMVSALLNRRAISCGCHIVGGKKGKLYSDPRMSSAKKIYREVYKDGDLQFEDFLTLSQQNCFYCDASPQNSFNVYFKENGTFIYNGLDRIDNTLPHNLNNIVPCCIDCNKAKMKRTTQEFFDWINRVFQKHLEKK